MKRLFLLFSIFFTLLCIACSNGGGKEDNSSDSTVSGIAAAGAPVIGTVYVKDVGGLISSTAINPDGSYSINITSQMTAPFLIYVEGMCGSKVVRLYSFSDGANIANVTPVTTAIVASAINNNPIEAYPPDLFKNDIEMTIPSAADIGDASDDMIELLNSIYDQFDIETDFNPLTDVFTADNTGFDQLLDILGIDITGSEETTELTITDRLTGTVVFDDVLGDADEPVNNITAITGSAADMAAIVAKVKQWQDLTNQKLSNPAMDLKAALLSGNICSEDFLHHNPWADEESDPETLNRDSWTTAWGDPASIFYENTASVKYTLSIVSAGERSINAGTYTGGYTINAGSDGSGAVYGLVSIECFNSSGHSLGKTPSGKMTFSDVSGTGSNDWRLCGDRNSKSDIDITYIQTVTATESSVQPGIHFGWNFNSESESGPSEFNGQTIDMIIIKGQGIDDGFTGEEHALIMIWDGSGYSPLNYSTTADDNNFYIEFDASSVTSQDYLYVGLHNNGSSYDPILFDVAAITAVPINPDLVPDIESKFIAFPPEAPSLDALSISGQLSDVNPWNISLTWEDLNGQPREVKLTIAGNYDGGTSYNSEIRYQENGGEELPSYAVFTPSDNDDATSTLQVNTNTWLSTEIGNTLVHTFNASDISLLELEIVTENEQEGVFYNKKVVYKGSYGPSGEVIEVTWVSLDTHKVILENIGDTVQLTATIEPSEATYKSVTWESSNTEIATVNESGEVTAVNTGVTYITAYSKNMVEDSCLIIVGEYIPVTGISLSSTEETIEYIGDTVQLIATVEPSNATIQTIVWKSFSRKESVATVDENGLVTALGLGVSYITAESLDNPEIFDSCKVIADGDYIPVDIVYLNLLEETLENIGDTVQLIPTFIPVDATDKTVFWVSLDESVATVDENGLVTAVSSGEATIDVNSLDGPMQSCTIHVE